MKIILVRHGMPAWDFRTPISGREFAAWRQGEDAAPIDPSHRPSAALEGLVRDASCVAASTLRRSLESARLLAPATAPLIDATFREAELPSRIRLGLRLPPELWGLFARSAWFCGWSAGVESFRAARARAVRAATLLATCAAEHGTVALVGHGLMNVFIARRLRAAGWSGPRLTPQRHWGYASYERIAA